MKRKDLTAGSTYAYRRGSWGSFQRAEVLTTDPMVETKVSSYSYRPAPLEPVTLPDGSVIQAAARKPSASTPAASKGVLVRLSGPRYESDNSDRKPEVLVVRLMDLHGDYEVVAQAERDRKDREAQRKAHVADERRAAANDLADLTERLEALLPQATLRQEGNHYTDGLPSKLVILDRESLRSLIEIIERELH